MIRAFTEKRLAMRPMRLSVPPLGDHWATAGWAERAMVNVIAVVASVNIEKSLRKGRFEGGYPERQLALRSG